MCSTLILTNDTAETNFLSRLKTSVHSDKMPRSAMTPAPAPSMDLASMLRLLAALVVGAVFSVLPLAQLMWHSAAALLSLKFPACSVRDRPYPARMADARWGQHHVASVNGLRMHYVERGPGDGVPGGSGAPAATTRATGSSARPPLLLCLHGFPECWYSWRWVLAAFSSHYRVVAPDLRGFGETSRGESSWARAYESRLEVLVADVAALLDALGEADCELVGHDWGAVVAYAFATAHPRRVRRLAILNGPHPAAMWDTLSIGQVLRSFYLFVFQLPLLPEIWLRAGDAAFLRGAMLGRAMGARRRGEEPLALDARDADAFTWALTRAGGLTAAVNWYRCIFSHNAAYHASAGMEREGSLRMPHLVVWGEDDGALGGSAMPRAAAAYAQAGATTVALIPRCSHWTQQDAVAEALHALAAFFGCRVPPSLRLPADAYTVSGAPLPVAPADAPVLHDVRAMAAVVATAGA